MIVTEETVAVIVEGDGAAERPTVGGLFAELAEETGTLVRQEIKLAATEMTHKATDAGKKIGFVAAGGMLGTVALLTLVGALVLALGMVMPLWASALLVGGVLLVTAAALAFYGINALRRIDPKPKETIRSIEETKSWARAHIR